ncbi:MAG: GNAT family N-acetyltransferase [Clostridia bacterium]|nr:GNAT family N-acetyltransferase [Clostridia bacterium]
MSFTYRKATENDYEKYLDFANLVFSNAHRPHDFQTLIPKVYGEGRNAAYMQNIAVRDDGAIRGLVAVMPNTLRIMDTVLKTGYVGTVSVHPYARGEGHMKKLMAMAIENAENDGLDIMMLGGQRQRYEYFGFTKGGVSLNHRVTSTNLRHVLGDINVDNIEIVDIRPDDAEIIAKCCELHNANAVAAARTPEEFYIIAITWYAAPKAVIVDSEFAGFMIANGEGISELRLKDVKLTGPVIKKYMQHANVSHIGISTGAYETELNREFAKMEEGLDIGTPEMLRIFNFPKVIGALMELKASYSALEDAEVAFVIDGKPMTVRVKDGVPSVTDELCEGAAELTAMEAQRLFLGFDGELLVGRLPLGWANLPLYMSHVDAF